MTIWRFRQTWHFFITAECHAECVPYTFNIAATTILDFWMHNFQETVFSTVVVYTLWKQVEKILCEVLWNFSGWFWNQVPLKVVPAISHTNKNWDHSCYISKTSGGKECYSHGIIMMLSLQHHSSVVTIYLSAIVSTVIPNCSMVGNASDTHGCLVSSPSLNTIIRADTVSSPLYVCSSWAKNSKIIHHVGRVDTEFTILRPNYYKYIEICISYHTWYCQLLKSCCFTS